MTVTVDRILKSPIDVLHTRIYISVFRYPRATATECSWGQTPWNWLECSANSAGDRSSWGWLVGSVREQQLLTSLSSEWHDDERRPERTSSGGICSWIRDRTYFFLLVLMSICMNVADINVSWSQTCTRFAHQLRWTKAWKKAARRHVFTLSPLNRVKQKRRCAWS